MPGLHSVQCSECKDVLLEKNLDHYDYWQDGDKRERIPHPCEYTYFAKKQKELRASDEEMDRLKKKHVSTVHRYYNSKTGEEVYYDQDRDAVPYPKSGIVPFRALETWCCEKCGGRLAVLYCGVS